MENDFESKVGNHPLGPDYHFKLSTRAIRKIEQELCLPFVQVTEMLQEGSVNVAAVMIRHGTQPEISDDQVDDALDRFGFAAFMDPLAEAIQKSGLFKVSKEPDDPPDHVEKKSPTG